MQSSLLPNPHENKSVTSLILSAILGRRDGRDILENLSIYKTLQYLKAALRGAMRNSSGYLLIANIQVKVMCLD